MSLPEDRPVGDGEIVRVRHRPPVYHSTGAFFPDLASEIEGHPVDAPGDGPAALLSGRTRADPPRWLRVRRIRIWRVADPATYLEQTWDPATGHARALHPAGLDTPPEDLADLWRRGRILLGGLERAHGPKPATPEEILATLQRAALRLYRDPKKRFTADNLADDEELACTPGHLKRLMRRARTGIRDLKKFALTMYPNVPDSRADRGVR